MVGWAMMVGAGCGLVAGLDNPTQGGGGTGGATAGGAGGNTTSASCGNGTKEAGEECDDGNHKDADGCEADCTLPKCGNGIVDPGELCFSTHSTTVPIPLMAGYDGLSGLELIDCDLDGDLDIVTSSLAAARNDGTGTFDKVVQTENVLGTWGLARADLGGGSYELVAATLGAGRTYWYSPDPAANCTYLQTGGLATYSGLLGFTVINANGNAIPDVAKVFAGQGGQYGKISMNIDHDPGDSASSSVWSDLPSGVTAGDLVGDAGEDLVIAATVENEVVIIDNFQGTFGNNSLVFNVPGGGVGDQPVSVAVGDLDKDGALDIVTANAGAETIAVLHNLGAGTFAAQIPEPSVKGTNGVVASKPRFVVLGDVNVDGFVDAVTANSGDPSGKSSVSVFLNDGTGRLLLATKAEFPAVEYDSPFEVGRQPVSLRLGDLNGDGAIDIAAANAYVENSMTSVTVLLSSP
jgi:cysteine-rich repeat protein